MIGRYAFCRVQIESLHPVPLMRLGVIPYWFNLSKGVGCLLLYLKGAAKLNRLWLRSLQVDVSAAWSIFNNLLPGRAGWGPTSRPDTQKWDKIAELFRAVGNPVRTVFPGADGKPVHIVVSIDGKLIWEGTELWLHLPTSHHYIPTTGWLPIYSDKNRKRQHSV